MGKGKGKRTSFIVFHRKNKVKYSQDFTFKICIPVGIKFRLNKVDNSYYVLSGPGFGLHGDYGNGALYPYKLTKTQKKKFEEAWNRGV